GTLPTGSGVS
uniref:Sperm-activating peptide (Thr-2,5, Leu-3, Pro-4, Ser-7,10 SAP-I) n=1 Tax=Heterocentrotus mammillatus TaxID=31180 RepID=Q7M4B8_HETMA|nr:sperm-activating peptide I (2,5-Thr,3-Leu,4-Pro,7,10-Ser) [Heterocentrotus mammillatus]